MTDDDPTIGLEIRQGQGEPRDRWLSALDRERHGALSREVAARHRSTADVRHPALHFPATGRCPSLRAAHLRQIVRKMAVQIATEKSRGNTTVTVPVHPTLQKACGRRARPASIGAEVFTGKRVKGRVLPMNKKAWAMKFKKYAVLAGVNEPKKSCHGVRKARAEVAAYADCTESQMMAMFGWTRSKDASASTSPRRIGKSSASVAWTRSIAFDQSQSLDDFCRCPMANSRERPTRTK